MSDRVMQVLKATRRKPTQKENRCIKCWKIMQKKQQPSHVFTKMYQNLSESALLTKSVHT